MATTQHDDVCDSFLLHSCSFSIHATERSSELAMKRPNGLAIEQNYIYIYMYIYICANVNVYWIFKKSNCTKLIVQYADALALRQWKRYPAAQQKKEM